MLVAPPGPFSCYMARLAAGGSLHESVRASRAKRAGAARRVGELVHDVEHDTGHGLHDELRDPVPAADHDGLVPVVVDQGDLDLAAVAGVDGAGGVDDGQPVAGGEPGAGVQEAGVPGGDGDGDPGGDEGPFAWGQGDGDGCLLYTSPSPRD